MRFLHTSDLHIGKKIFEVSLYEAQRAMLAEIHRIAVEQEVDAVVIAGDVYDRSLPQSEAVGLLDEFLTGLVREKLPVILISGNHDSPERLRFGAEILKKQGLYISGGYEGRLNRVSIQNGERETVFVSLPYVKPAMLDKNNNQEAVQELLRREQIDFRDGKQYVLITHYFVTGGQGEVPRLLESGETVDVGGIDNVTADLFDGFLYVALGHIHRQQRVGAGAVYYSGSPMKYSFSEAAQTKTVNLVEIGEDDSVRVSQLALRPYREMRVIRGRLQALISSEVVNADGVSNTDYIQAILTDQEALIDPMGTLRSVYPNILQIILEKNYVVNDELCSSAHQGEEKSIRELFGEFYHMLTGGELSGEQWAVVDKAAL